jgi:hypothetical protein
MKALESLGFISTKPGPSGLLSYAIIWNPYHVIARQHEAKHPGVTEEAFNALRARSVEIGAKDLDNVPKPTSEPDDDIPF